jgi:hypothetical protein
MARTAAFAIPLGILLAWSWSRLELPRTGLWPLLLMVALGVAPAFLPTRRWRLAGVAIALLLAAAFALDARPYGLGTRRAAGSSTSTTSPSRSRPPGIG